ncbi:MAG: toxin-antitoxin system HicB family antitoxin [Myxococcota bacterium]|jgi:hypothetical protein
MQYTLRRISPALDRALRRHAREAGKSLNQIAVEALQRGLGLTEEPVRRRSLEGIRGTWIDDPEFDAAIRDQDQIDPDLWK